MFTLSTFVDEIPPLFCQLDELQRNSNGEYICWKEKARWIRFEENAENVLGRWSKPHVATIPQVAMDTLKELLSDGLTVLNLTLNDNKELPDYLISKLGDYFDERSAQRFKEVLNLPHFHHHQKNMEKTLSSMNLQKLLGAGGSGNLHELPDSKDKDKEKEKKPENMDAFASVSDIFKENTKFKRKVNRKAEGASVLVAPLDFVKQSKMIFIRFQAAMSIPSLLEVNLSSRFMVIILGALEKQSLLYEVGRAISTCLSDEYNRELFYNAQLTTDLSDIVNNLSRNTMVIPPSEWDPKIRIEPPDRYLSIEERKAATEITDYIHDNRLSGESHGDPNLQANKIPFFGLLADIKRKIPFYISDITDALNVQCIAAALYLYLVSLCSLVAFGALLGQNTDDYMATMECILAGSLSGILFALFSGQPLNILSATGPMLILENIIATLCKKFSMDFMEFRLWIGIWIAVLLFLLVLFNLSFLVKFITRFTEDCFASLVAIMFIIDALKSVFKINEKYPAYINVKDGESEKLINCFCNITNTSYSTKNYFWKETETDKLFLAVNTSVNCFAVHGEWVCDKIAKHHVPDVFFFSILLFLLTFVICMMLKSFRDSPFFPTGVRQMLSDFAVLIAILLMSILNGALGVKTPKLLVPSKLIPTRSDRGWFIPFFGKNPWWSIFVAIVPAFIATLLVFMDQQITAVIVNRKEFKLKKSSGYHLDLLVVAVCIACCSILGLPWFVAATVLALTHVNALKIMSENSAPGEKPTFLGVREQRMTTLIMSLLIGLSVLFTKVLSYIPMPVLYAVFLYMGVTALGGLQVVDRILIIFMPAKYQPDYPYLRHVNTNRVHIYTVIQILSTGGMYLVKQIDAIAITFPLLVVATCGVRKLMDYVFMQRELFWLDQLLPHSKLEDEDFMNPGSKCIVPGIFNRCFGGGNKNSEKNKTGVDNNIEL